MNLHDLYLICARGEALLLDTVDVLDMGVAADIAENLIHTKEGLAGADAGIIIVRHRVEERHARALGQDLIVGCCEKAIRESISETNQTIVSMSCIQIPTESTLG